MTATPQGPTIPPNNNNPKVVDYSAFKLRIESSKHFADLAKTAVNSELIEPENEKDSIDIFANIGSQPSKIEISQADLFLEGMALARIINVTSEENNTSFRVNVDTEEAWHEKVPGSVQPPQPDSQYTDEIHSQDKLPELFILHAAKILFEPNDQQFSALCALVEIAQIALPETIYKIKKLADVERPNPQGGRILPIPNHKSWPGGHSYWTANLAILISQTFQGKSVNSLMNVSKRIGKNRERAGIHWSTDTDSGIKLGTLLMTELIKHIAERPDDFPVFTELVRRARLQDSV